VRCFCIKLSRGVLWPLLGMLNVIGIHDCITQKKGFARTSNFLQGYNIFCKYANVSCFYYSIDGKFFNNSPNNNNSLFFVLLI